MDTPIKRGRSKRVVTSPYFKRSQVRDAPSRERHDMTTSLHVDDDTRGAHCTVSYTPPKSPYGLIQEELYDKPWQLLLATIFLHKTSGKVAIPVFRRFLNVYETAEQASSGEWEDIAEIMQPLGLSKKRAKLIIRFSHDYLHKVWKYPMELFGIGKYGDDSYRIFCLGQWRSVQPNDHKLNMYHDWLTQNDRLGLID